MDKPLLPQNQVSDGYAAFWNYLSKPQQNLLLEGNYLMNDVIRNSKYSFQDYSFLVFPFAKSYEGFLKKIFLDAHFISHLDYISDHLRLGKLLSPNLTDRLGDRSLYKQLSTHVNEELAALTWDTWRLGRNEIFHYFPHNLRSISFTQAEEVIAQIVQTMQKVYLGLKPLLKSDTLSIKS